MRDISEEELHSALHRAMRGALAKLAPIGGERSIGVNAICNCMVEMLAELLAAVEPSHQEVGRLAELFHKKLREAVSRREGPVGTPKRLLRTEQCFLAAVLGRV